MKILEKKILEAHEKLSPDYFEFIFDNFSPEIVQNLRESLKDYKIHVKREDNAVKIYNDLEYLE